MFPHFLRWFTFISSSYLMIPMDIRTQMSVSAIRDVFIRFIGLEYVIDEKDDCFTLTTKLCPFCLNQQSTMPLCQIQKGLLEQWFSWILRQRIEESGMSKLKTYEFDVRIDCCLANGAESGNIVFYKKPI